MAVKLIVQVEDKALADQLAAAVKAGAVKGVSNPVVLDRSIADAIVDALGGPR